MSAIVPWTYPGGPPCCCAPACPNEFNQEFWDTILQNNLAFHSITPEQAAALFAGGTVSVDIDASLSITGTGDCDFSGSATVAGSNSAENAGGCVSAISTQITAATPSATAIATVSVSPVGEFNTRPTGSLTSNIDADASATLSYQIVQVGADYGVYLGLRASVTTGLVQIPQTGGVTFQGGGGMIGVMTFVGGSGTATASFLEATVSSTGYFYQVEGNYGLNSVVSGSGSVTASFDLVAAAP